MELMTHSSSFLFSNPSAAAASDSGAVLTYVLVVLNRNLPRFTPLLWNNAQIRICADGGANRLYDELPLLFPEEAALAVRQRYKPDLIKGDMDSVREDVSRFYRDLGTEVVDASHDQDTTDLHKCVAYIRDLPNLKNQNACVKLFYLITMWIYVMVSPLNDKVTVKFIKSNSLTCILVAGALGGRFDHEAGNINVLCRFSSTRIVLLSDDCLIQLLPSSHHHKIHIHPTIEGPHCGLVPISGLSKSSTTTGLQWNLSDTEMKFGGLISTSNIVKDEIVTVRSDSDLLWTISLRKIG